MCRCLQKPTDVGVEHPVHLLRQQPLVQRCQRIVLAAPGPEPVRKSQELRVVDRVQHRHRRPLDDLVLQHRHPQRPLPPISLGYVRSRDRLRPVRSPSQPLGQVPQVCLQVLPVVLPGLPIHAWRGCPLEADVRLPQHVQGIHLVVERGEPHLPVSLGCLPYPLQTTAHAPPAQYPVRVGLGRIPLGRPLPSTGSAAGCPALFASFAGTTGLSDCSSSSISGVRPRPSRCAPIAICRGSWSSPGSRARCLHTCSGSPTTWGSLGPATVTFGLWPSA